MTASGDAMERPWSSEGDGSKIHIFTFSHIFVAWDFAHYNNK